MNKHMRLLFAALIIVIIVLAAAITRFYSHTDNNVYEGGSQSAIAKKLDINSGYILFQDSSGMYGLADSSERVVVSPEWESLRFTDSAFLIAEKHSHGNPLLGCIDYDGDITVPLVYDSIEKKDLGGMTFYIATAHSDGSFVIYSNDFEPCFTRAWDKYDIGENEITLSTKKGSYIYTVNKNGFTLKKATLPGKAMAHDYELSITSKYLFSKLTDSMMEDMNEATGKYLEYAFSGDEKYLDDINAAENPLFTPLFPNEERIKSKKLTGVTDIFLYSKRSDDNTPHFAVSVTVHADIVYTDENKRNARMDGRYTAVIEFTGSSAGELKAVSGSFNEAAPEYPAPEPEHPSISEHSDTESGDAAGEEGTAGTLTTTETTALPQTENIYQ